MYNIIRVDSFQSRKGETWHILEFCDENGSNRYMSKTYEDCFKLLAGKPYLSEFEANVHRYRGSDGQYHCFVDNVKVK